MLHTHYTQLTRKEREILSRLKIQGCSLCHIANVIGRNVSTISREVKRNNRNGVYHPHHAHADAMNRKYVQPCKIDRNPQLHDYIRGALRKRWSPELIAHHVNTNGMIHDSIHHETIYRWIYRQKCREYTLCLARKRGRRISQTWKRCNQFTTKNIHTKSIHTLHAIVSDVRTDTGHWQLDTIIGKQQSCIAVLLECASRYLYLQRLPRLQRDYINQFVITWLSHYPSYMKQSIVCDNGQENMGYREIERMLNIPCYFCDPYCSTQKAQIENANGLIRAYFPKGTSFDTITDEDVLHCQEELNTRPRKCLNWKTPQEVHGMSP